MEITGSQNIGATRQRVWDALNDPAILKRCLPGCESVERLTPVEFRVVMAAAIGPLRARFTGALSMTETNPPESCLMKFEGQGGVVGFGKGTSSVSLAESPDGTVLSYVANAQVGGKLAQVGSRLIDSVARKMADDFFAALRRELVPENTAAQAVEASKLPAESAPDTAASVTPRALIEAGGDAPEAEPRSSRKASDAPAGARLVPGWWLAASAGIGAATAIAGMLAARYA